MPKPRVGILGWGSLLWEADAQFDSCHGAWQYDGPSLRLEFSRVSNSRLKALTLVIDSRHGVDTTVAWTLSKRGSLEEAISDLRCRERTTLAGVGRVSTETSAGRSRDSASLAAVAPWGETKQLDAVVWTDLPNNFKKEAGRPFSVESAVAFLQDLNPASKVEAAEYIRRAPEFVKTPLRKALQQLPLFTSGATS